MDAKVLEKLIEQYESLREGMDINYQDDGEFPLEEMQDILDISFDDLDEKFQNMMNVKEIKYKKLSEDAADPSYNYGGDSGFDLFSTQDVEIAGLGRALIPTGLSFQFDEGYEIQVRSKSGLAINQGLMVLNSPGTVDHGYLGEIKVIVFNTNQHPVKITKGMKVAQAVLCPVVNGKNVHFEKMESFDQTDRGDKGFGSTGI
jgi:dUTP pyrophosphatase